MIHGVPLFVVEINEDFSFHTYHCGSSCSIPSLSSDQIYCCKLWSTLNEIIRFLQNKVMDHKKEVLMRSLVALGKNAVDQKLYSPEVIVQAFDYFATSSASYKKLWKDYALPSISTLSKITSKINKIDDTAFYSKSAEHFGE